MRIKHIKAPKIGVFMCLTRHLPSYILAPASFLLLDRAFLFQTSPHTLVRSFENRINPVVELLRKFHYGVKLRTPAGSREASLKSFFE